MKYIQSTSLLILVILTMNACSKTKNKEEEPKSLTDQLKGSHWTGEFRYMTGIFQGLQPFSLNLDADGAATWSDLSSTRSAGKWAVEGDIVTITLLDNSKLTAKVVGDTWTGFTNTNSAVYRIDNLSKAMVQDPAKLAGTTWSEIGGSMTILKFPEADKVEVYTTGVLRYSGPYTSEGTGIRFQKYPGGTVNNYYYVAFFKPSVAKGINLSKTIADSYYPFLVTKN